MTRATTALDRITAARTDAMIHSLALDDDDPPFEGMEWADPGRMLLRNCSDDDLAEIIGVEPASKTGILARSILNRRESWRTPAKWSFVIALVSFFLGLVAFIRTL